MSVFLISGPQNRGQVFETLVFAYAIAEVSQVLRLKAQSPGILLACCVVPGLNPRPSNYLCLESDGS